MLNCLIWTVGVIETWPSVGALVRTPRDPWLAPMSRLSEQGPDMSPTGHSPLVEAILHRTSLALTSSHRPQYQRVSLTL